MHEQASSSTPTEGALEMLAQEVAQLRDLFQRRLFEDKAKNKLYEELYEQLTIARGGLTERLLAPLFRELLLIVDRVGRLRTDGDVVLESIEDELLEVLGRWGVRPVPSADAFDPAIHDAVRTEAHDDQLPGSIVEVLRRGYMIGAQVLRGEQVVVAARRVAAAEVTEKPTAVVGELPADVLP